ncbi:MAG: TPM domain-containing protein [Planctomycetaceae bacterium]|nr:TPM domain-containing protein [Planctomycetaceae bacterium]
MKRTLLYVLCFALLPQCVPAAKVSLPVPANYVEDKAAIVSAEHEQRLNGLLKELEQKTGVQFIVLTVKTTGGIPIEQYSIELAEQWKLGQADKDNGLLFTIAFDDRAYRFEIGYGLEEFLTDQYCGRVGRDVLVPAMRQGRSSEGIYQTTLAIVNTIAKHYNVQLSGIPAGYRPPAKQGSPTPCCAMLYPIFFILLFVTLASRGSILWPLWLLFGMRYGAGRNPYSHSQRGYWGSGGGFGGGFGGRGGFGGGFGGGGGGGFGGGGASGGW